MSQDHVHHRGATWSWILDTYALAYGAPHSTDPAGPHAQSVNPLPVAPRAR